MSWVVYGFRLRGDREVRYIGQTCHSADQRLQFLSWEARKMPRATTFAAWLNEHAGSVESFILEECATEAAARDSEREHIKAAARMGQRLFNRQHVPTACRIAPRDIAAARRIAA